jgi:hypothetical protein
MRGIMRFRHIGVALLIVLLGAFVVAPLGAAAQPTEEPTGLPITGTTLEGGTFSGVVTSLHFFDAEGTLTVEGFVVGTVTDSQGLTLPYESFFAGNATVTTGENCTSFSIAVEPLLGVQAEGVTLDPIMFDFSGAAGDSIFGSLFCYLVTPFQGMEGSNAYMASLLNRLAAAYGLGQPPV